MKKILFVPIFVVLITVLSFLPQDAHAATTIDLKDQTSCQAAPLSGIWDVTTSTCTIGSFTLNPGDSLTVDNSVFPNIVLTITGTLTNGDTINNHGTIKIQSQFGHLNSLNGTIVNNYGTINVTTYANIFISGTLNNYGTINNYGNFYDNNVLNNKVGGTINNSDLGVISQGVIYINFNRTLNNSGTININQGAMHDDGTLNNNGTINIHSYIISTGNFNNNATINIISGSLTNHGTFNNYAKINNNPPGTISNFGTINNKAGGVITNNGTFQNFCGGIINNSGTISGNPIIFSECGRTSHTTVTPNPAATPIGTSMTFHVKVVDSDTGTKILPTGTVSWSDGGAGGTFGSSSCKLTPLTGISTCAIKYTSPSTAGPVTIKAAYSGDGNHKTSFGTSALTVTLRSTVSTVTPNPASTTVGTKIVFHLRVVDSSTGSKTLPTGTATWSDGGAGGNFAHPSCTLTPRITISECTIVYTPSTAGLVPITATYSGDGTHKTSSGTSALTVS